MGVEVRNITVARPLAETLYWQICRNNNRGPFCSSRPDRWPSAGYNQVGLTYPEHGRAVPGTSQFCLNYLNWFDYFSSPSNTQGDSFERFINAHATLKADSQKNLESLQRTAQFCRDVGEEEKKELEKTRRTAVSSQRRRQETPPLQTTSGTPPPPPDTPTDKSEGSKKLFAIVGAAVLACIGLVSLYYLRLRGKRARANTEEAPPPPPAVSLPEAEVKPPKPMDARLMRVPTAEEIRLGEINAKLSTEKIILQLFVSNPRTAGLAPLEKTEIAAEAESEWRGLGQEQQLAFVDLSEKYEAGTLPKKFFDRFLAEHHSPERRRAEKIYKELHEAFVVPQLVDLAQKTFSKKPYARIDLLSQEDLIELGRLAISEWKKLKQDERTDFVDLSDARNTGELPTRFVIEFFGSHLIDWYAKKISGSVTNESALQQLVNEAVVLGYLRDEQHVSIADDILMAWKTLTVAEIKRHIDAGDKDIFKGRLPQSFVSAYVNDRNRARLWEGMAINNNLKPEALAPQLGVIKPILEHVPQGDLTTIVDDLLSKWKGLSLEKQLGYLTGEYYPLGGLPAKFIVEVLENNYDPKAWMARAITNTADPNSVERQFKAEHRELLDKLDKDIKKPGAGQMVVLKWRSLSTEEQMGFVEIVNGNGLRSYGGGLPRKFVAEYLNEWLARAFTANMKENSVFWQLLLSSDKIYQMEHPEQERVTREMISRWGRLSMAEEAKFIDAQDGSLNVNLLNGRLPQRFVAEFIDNFFSKGPAGEGGSGGSTPSPPRGMPPPPPPRRPVPPGGGASAASVSMPQSPVMAGAAVFTGGVQPMAISAPVMFAPLMPPPIPAYI